MKANASKAVRTALEQAASRRSIVRIQRPRTMAPQWLDTYVIDVGTRFVLLAPVRDRNDLDGYDVVRMADITAVDESPKAAFYRRVLHLQGERVVRPRGIQLSSAQEVLASVDARHRVVVVHRECVHRDECEVGRVVRLSSRTYGLVWLDPLATWERDDRTFFLRDVTRVQFGGAYERTLVLAAGPAPKDLRG